MGSIPGCFIFPFLSMCGGGAIFSQFSVVFCRINIRNRIGMIILRQNFGHKNGDPNFTALSLCAHNEMKAKLGSPFFGVFLSQLSGPKTRLISASSGG